MTPGQLTRSFLFGAVIIGGALAGAVHSVYRWTSGTNEHWVIPAVLGVIGGGIWLGFKIVQERVLSKDYNKLLEERRRRMR